MRIEFASTPHPARVAKTLLKLLNADGGDLRLAQAQDIAAAMFGHGTWRELSKAAGRSDPSPWDEGIGEAERLARRSLYVAALVSRGIPEDKASAIVDEIRPTSRRLKAVRQGSGWRDRLRDRADANGFLDVDADLANYDWPEKFRDGCRNGQGRTRELPIALPDGSGAVLRIRQSPNMTEAGDVRVCPIQAALIGDGRLLGFVDGYVVTCPDGELTHPEDFFDGCDMVEDDVASAADRLLGLYGVEELFEDTNAIFLLCDWVAARGVAPAGTGAAFLDALLRSLKRSYRIGAVALDLHPAQFFDIDHDKRLLTQGFSEARRHLQAYWDRIAPHTVLGEWAQTFHFDSKPGTGAPINDGLLLLGRRATEARKNRDGEEAPSIPAKLLKSVDALSPEEVERIGAANPTLGAMLRSATRTDPREPKPLMPEDWPDGFDIEWAAQARSFDPHPALWDHMPSDIVSIKVRYKDLEEGVKDVEKVVYRFANETELEISGDYLIGGRSIGEMPDAFVAGNGLPIVVNPFTDRYLIGRLSETLQINSLLLFSGSRDRPLRWPNEAQKTRHEPIVMSAT